MRGIRQWPVRVLCALLLLSSLASGDDKRRFFSISTDKTYLPGETIKLRMYSQGVDVLEFRVYRVNNPAKFFENLQDVHNFGARTLETRREHIDERTWLEEFHDWKHELWVEMRNYIRGQFSPASRAEIREKESGQAKSSSIIESAGFADVPLLAEIPKSEA